MLHCVPISYSSCFFQLSATLPHIPHVLPFPVRNYGRAIRARSRQSSRPCGVFRVPTDGQHTDRPGAAVPGSGCPVPVQRFPAPCGRWSTCPGIGAPVPVQRLPVNGQRFPVGHCLRIGSPSTVPGSGCLLSVNGSGSRIGRSMVNLSDIGRIGQH